MAWLSSFKCSQKANLMSYYSDLIVLNRFSVSNMYILNISIYGNKVKEHKDKWEFAKMVEEKKNKRANAMKEVKRLSKKFGFVACMLKCSLAHGRKK
jgi:hypothetical protein